MTQQVFVEAFTEKLSLNCSEQVVIENLETIDLFAEDESKSKKFESEWFSWRYDRHSSTSLFR